MEPLAGLSVFLGAFSAFLLLSMRTFPQRWARLYADAGREKGRPAWAWACIGLSLSGIVLFWYLHFAGEVYLSLAIAVMATLLMGRAAQSLMVKKGLRGNVQLMLQGNVGRAFLPYTIASIALVILGLL
ncbi:MAG TPA: hypothetical protein PLQ92_04355 [Methanomassiliicoccales archaeon]|nr:hypothetical protein [Methanomassiliicoccales archaeon]